MLTAAKIGKQNGDTRTRKPEPGNLNLSIYRDATRDNSKFKLFHQQENFAYSKSSFAFAAVVESIPTRLLIC
jgi:hypothetical protein